MPVRVYSTETFVAGLITCGCVLAYYLLRPHVTRSGPLRASNCRFVYVNQDGSIREVSPSEQAYLTQDFAPNDSAGPYIKAKYDSRDGWGSLSGFMDRRGVPPGVPVQPAHPDYDAREKALGFDPYEADRAAGELVEKLPDGSVVTRPNPAVPPHERFERLRQCHLEIQRRREALARVGPPPLNAAAGTSNPPKS